MNVELLTQGLSRTPLIYPAITYVLDRFVQAGVKIYRLEGQVFMSSYINSRLAVEFQKIGVLFINYEGLAMFSLFKLSLLLLFWVFVGRDIMQSQVKG